MRGQLLCQNVPNRFTDFPIEPSEISDRRKTLDRLVFCLEVMMVSPDLLFGGEPARQGCLCNGGANLQEMLGRHAP